MDEIKRILENYKDVKARKKEEEQQREGHRLREEKQWKKLNAWRLERHMHDVIKLVLDEAQRDILASGFSCEVEINATHDLQILEEGQTFTVSLKMVTAREDMREPAWLEYEGQSDPLTLKVVECAGDTPAPRQKEELPLNTYNRNRVEQQVKAFVEKVFTVPQDNTFSRRSRTKS